MNKAIMLAIMVSVASFALFAQQEGLRTTVYSDFGFDNFQAQTEITYHPLAKFGNKIITESKKDSYTIGMENKVKEKAIACKTFVDSLAFNMDEIKYQDYKHNAFTPANYGASNWDFDRAAMMYVLRYYYGGMEFDSNYTGDELNLLIDQDFFPNSDKRYANMIIVKTVAREIVPELTIDQIENLPISREIKSGEVYSLTNLTVEEAYELISTKHEKDGFDFLIYPKDVENADIDLKSQGIEGPNLREKTIQAKRQKIASYIRWASSLPRTIEAFKILAFVWNFNEVQGVDANFVVNMARNIAEWKLMNENWEYILLDSMKGRSIDVSNGKNWPDICIGVKINSYSSSGEYATFASDAMLRAGFGYNFGDSFVYAFGNFGVPFIGSDFSDARYEASINSNICFVRFFETHADVYYYNDGRLRGVIKPNFIIFDFIEIGGGLDFTILKSDSSNVFAEVFIAKIIGANISHDMTNNNTSISAIVKF